MNTYGDIGNATAGWYARKLLRHAVPVIILERFGLIKPLPQNETKIIEFRRSKPFTAATIPLTEGRTPSGSDFGYDTISASIQQYGDYSTITDVIQDTSKDMVLRDMTERMGEQIGETREALTWDVIRAGTNVAYGGTVTTRATITKLSLLNSAKQRTVTTSLARQKAKKFTKVLGPSENYDTYAIEPSYIAVGHTDLTPTVRDLKGSNVNNIFQPYTKYGARMGMVSPHEIGNYEEVRYVMSPDLEPFRGKGATIASGDEAAWFYTAVGATNKYDAYPLLYLGRDAFGCIPLRGKQAVRPMVVQPRPSHGDPLGQKGSVGWKFYFGCLMLNEAWAQRLEVACPK